jgi:uncharacterized membrane protein HdeD (DUF308 family)
MSIDEAHRTMRPSLSSSWWVLAVRGVAALVFGILTLLWPGLTLLVFVVLFAVHALISGSMAIVGAFRHRSEKGWWVTLLLGLVSVAAGLVAVFNPALTLFVLVLLVAAHAVVTGIFDIVAAIRLRKEIEREWLLVLAGLVSVVFGMLVFLFPPAGALALAFMAGFYAIFIGVVLLALALRARNWTRRSGSSDGRVSEVPRPM